MDIARDERHLYRQASKHSGGKNRIFTKAGSENQPTLYSMV